METAFSMPVGIRLSEEALIQDWSNTRLILSNDSSGECPTGLSLFVIVRDIKRATLYRSEEIPAAVIAESMAHDFGAERLPEGTHSIGLEIHLDGQVSFDTQEITFHKSAKTSEHCANPLTQEFLAPCPGAAELHPDVAGINEGLALAHDAAADALTRIKSWEHQRRKVTRQVTLEHPSAIFLECGGCGCGFSLNGSEPRIILPGRRHYAGCLPAGDVTMEFHSLFSLKNEPSLVRDVAFIPLKQLPGIHPAGHGLPMVGINDWTQYFADGSLPTFSQLAAIIQGQRELGFSEVAWSIGRSWLEYWSELPGTSRWPVVPLEIAAQRDPRAYNYVCQTSVMEQGCPLREAVKQAREQHLLFTAWMGLNSHYYAEAVGGICCSKWFQENPRFYQWRKGAKKPFPGEVSFYFPEVRQERIAILNEVAGLGVERFLLDGTRQPRVVLYQPEMTAEYQALTGVDPSAIDATSAEAYGHWIQWRSGFFTRFLREVREELSQKHPEKSFHLSLRIPQCGLQMNLASGFDVLTWFREGLINRLYLDPLEIYGGGLSEVTPYVEAGHASGVEVYGAIGQTWMWDGRAGATAALMRASSLIEAGVDGLDFFESELLSMGSEPHSLVSHLGDRDYIQALLKESNLPACHPFGIGNAMLGYDNHSRWDGKGWRLEGFGENCL
jgi:hypothetical protein